jgi:hypothetical protein
MDVSQQTSSLLTPAGLLEPGKHLTCWNLRIMVLANRGSGTKSQEQTPSLPFGHDADPVISKRECQGGTYPRHVAGDAVAALLPGDMRGLVSMTA